ncbi:MAG: N-acetyltransferase [Phycisphaerae bacterium]|nr:N-acetyltransferase [Phycisphaerae bacterium]
MSTRIRAELPSDLAAIRAVNEAAFASPAEADLVDTLRCESTPIVSLVGAENEIVVGHILFTPATLDGQPRLRLMGLGPMAVAPSHQRRGIGSALVRAGIDACAAIGTEAVVVLGHPSFYPRFGFAPSHRFGIGCEFDAPPEVFMVLELAPRALHGVSGTVHYHAAFKGV